MVMSHLPSSAGAADAPPPAETLIERSWSRCQHAPVARTNPEADGLSRGVLHDLLAQHQTLLDAARPELEQLGGLVDQAASMVLLADARGVILRADGSADFLARAARVALRPGVNWSEAQRGTNAIGTALVEGAPVRVHGAQHFLQSNRVLSCNGVPIRAGRGELLGVLDISHDANTVHAYALGLAQMAARQVANRLLEGRPGQHQVVLQRRPGLLETGERGLLLVEDGCVVAANEVAIELLGVSWASLLDQPLGPYLAGWQHLGQRPDLIHGAGGERFYATLRPARATPTVPGTNRLPATAPAPHPAPSTDAPPTPSPRRATSAPLPQLAPALQPELARSVRVLDAGLAVMLHGETGAGKEIYARHLHQGSRWRHGPFVAVNCAALPESLIEAELFGYNAGAFTGARRGGARGLLREADGGVLFLDEIGDMPLGLQARLLRVLQERAVQPLGSAESIPVEVAVISATHRDITQGVAEGSFRADLFYRLQDYRVTLPPLRERPDLAAHLVAAFTEALPATSAARLAPDTLACLLAHPWPGNYRELRAVLRTLALFAPETGEVTPEQLPASLTATAGVSSAGLPLPPTPEATSYPSTPAAGAHRLETLRADAIDACLHSQGGNVARAARQLGVHRSTLYRYLGRRTTAGA